ncbi:MAG: hypothetical protein ACPGJS_08195 [Flammeovirgaceae bacterium]
MNRFFFWFNWPLPYRLLYSLSFLILLAFLALLGYSAWIGDGAIMQWYPEGELEVVKVLLDRFTKNFFEFTIDADAYLLVEEFKATPLQINHLAYYLHLAGLVIGCILLLTAISDMPLAWYAGGITFVVFLIAVMSLELNRVTNKVDDKSLTLIMITVVAAVSYLFKSLLKNTSYFLRILVYSSIIGGFMWYIGENTQLNHSVMQATSYSIVLPLLMLAGFCLLNGHEMVRAITFIVTNSSGKIGGRTIRFILLSVFYILNLIYTFAHLNYGYDLDIYYLNPAMLLIITTLLGIWGFRNREETHYMKLFPFAPTGAFVYLGMAIIAASTLSFSIATGNDSFREMCEDVVMYGHIGMGLAFFAYVYFNFKSLIDAGKKAHRVLFKPLNIDYAWSWIFGVLVAFGFMLGNGFYIFYQGFSAYYISQADLEWVEGDSYSAKQFYNLALQYDLNSHRANYSIASIALEDNKRLDAYIFFEEAQKFDYRPYDYAQMAAIKNQENDYYEALFDLQLGVERFPKSGELLNNLALQFNQTNLADSAYIYFDLARKTAKMPEVVESNLFSIWTKYDFRQDIDSLYSDWKPRNYIGTRSNELAYLNKIGQSTDQQLDLELLPDSVLTTPQLCYLYNYALNQYKSGNDSLLQVLREKLTVPQNLEQFDKYLYFALGNMLYEKGAYSEAFTFLKGAQKAAHTYNAYFPNLIGLRMLQHDQYEKAAAYFKDAHRKGNEQALLHLAIAQSELADKSAAIETWKQLSNAANADERNIAHDMLRFLVKDSLAVLKLADQNTPDLVRYRYLHYHQQDISDQEFDEIYQQIKDVNFKITSAAERTHVYLDQGNLDLAAKYMQLLTREEISDEANSTFQMAYLRYTHAQGVLDDDFYQKVSTATFPFGKSGMMEFYQAEYQAQRKNFAEAEKLYLTAMEKLPFHPNVRIRLNDLYKAANQLEKGYLMLVDELAKTPESIVLLKAYVLSCLELAYTDYAAYGLEQLEALMTPSDFEAFQAIYAKKLTELEESLGDWNE